MLKISYVLLILSVSTSKIMADNSDCLKMNTIDNKDFENLPFEDICFIPEKLMILWDFRCNLESLNTITAVFQMMLNNNSIPYVSGPFVIEKNYERQCEKLYEFEKASIQYEWTLESGQLVIDTPGYNISKSDVCIKLHKPKDSDMYALQPHLCGVNKSTIDICIRVVSVFCMVSSICIYLFSYLPRNGSVHNKCCTCYIICKTVNFSLKTIDEIALKFGVTIPPFFCALITFMGYYSVLATYLWLLVINFNVWKSIINYELTWQESFWKFNKLVWYGAIGLFALSILVDYIVATDYKQVWSPKLVLLSCWLPTHDLMAIILMHGPVVLLILFNVTLSILTAIHIYKENRSICNEWSDSYVQNRIKFKTNYLFFFRLFVFTGAFSIFEKIYNIFVILRVFQYESVEYMEPIISLQGVLLFMLTVLRKEVIDTLCKRTRRNNSAARETASTEMTRN